MPFHHTCLRAWTDQLWRLRWCHFPENESRKKHCVLGGGRAYSGHFPTKLPTRLKSVQRSHRLRSREHRIVQVWRDAKVRWFEGGVYSTSRGSCEVHLKQFSALFRWNCTLWVPISFSQMERDHGITSRVHGARKCDVNVSKGGGVVYFPTELRGAPKTVEYPLFRWKLCTLWVPLSFSKMARDPIDSQTNRKNAKDIDR